MNALKQNARLGSKLLKLALASLSACYLLAPAAQAASDQNRQVAPTASQPEFLIAQEMGCPRAMPVAYFATETFHVSICEGQDGYLFYRGVEFADPSNAINVSDVEDYGNYDYLASNGNYSYAINPDQLTVYQDGEVIWQEQVISWNVP